MKGLSFGTKQLAKPPGSNFGTFSTSRLNAVLSGFICKKTRTIRICAIEPVLSTQTALKVQKLKGYFFNFLEKYQLPENAWAKFKTKHTGTLYDARALFWYHKFDKTTWFKFWYF